MASRVAILVSCALLLAATWQGAVAAPRLRVGYYQKKCPAAEYIVKGVVGKALKQNPGLGAGIIRMAFHDCFVQVRAQRAPTGLFMNVPMCCKTSKIEYVVDVAHVCMRIAGL
jgi:hypothetical protein